MLNNLAYALAAQGKVEKAQDELNGICIENAPASTEVCYLATQGFILLRSGNLIEGREYYNAAIRLSTARKLLDLRAHAMINLACEEVRLQSEGAVDVVAQAIASSKQVVRDADFQGIGNRLLELLITKAPSGGEIDRLIEELSDLIRPTKPRLPKIVDFNVPQKGQ